MPCEAAEIGEGDEPAVTTAMSFFAPRHGCSSLRQSVRAQADSKVHLAGLRDGYLLARCVAVGQSPQNAASLESPVLSALRLPSTCLEGRRRHGDCRAWRLTRETLIQSALTDFLESRALRELRPKPLRNEFNSKEPTVGPNYTAVTLQAVFE